MVSLSQRILNDGGSFAEIKSGPRPASATVCRFAISSLEIYHRGCIIIYLICTLYRALSVRMQRGIRGACCVYTYFPGRDRLRTVAVHTRTWLYRVEIFLGGS